jgi:hypothetical protein
MRGSSALPAFSISSKRNRDDFFEDLHRRRSDRVGPRQFRIDLSDDQPRPADRREQMLDAEPGIVSPGFVRACGRVSLADSLIGFKISEIRIICPPGYHQLFTNILTSVHTFAPVAVSPGLVGKSRRCPNRRHDRPRRFDRAGGPAMVHLDVCSRSGLSGRPGPRLDPTRLRGVPSNGHPYRNLRA